MRIKLDENLPAAVAHELRDLGHDVETVPEEKLTGSEDQVIWRVAQEEQHFLITQDLDFSDARHFRPGSHHGLLLVRPREPGRLALARFVTALFSTHDVERWARRLVVATERKLRILRR